MNKYKIFCTVLYCCVIMNMVCNGETGGIYREESYSQYNIHFQQLDADEYFYGDFEDNGIFTLYAKNTNINRDRIIGKFDISWGSYEFSADKKRMFFHIKSDDSFPPYFFVNGYAGTLCYVANMPRVVMGNKELDFIVCATTAADNFKDVDNFRFAVFDINNKKIVKYFYWNVNDKNISGSSINIYRSLDTNYDFCIDYRADKYFIIARCYYNISANKVVTIFDKSAMSESDYIFEEKKMTTEELGL